MASRDLVIGIDSSTSATKATVWDVHGKLVAEARVAIPLTNPTPGWFEQDANDWWSSTAGALKSLSKKVDPKRIAAVAISNQRETFGLFDADGTPVRQGLVWLDERALTQTDSLADMVGRDRIHEICGKPVDPIVPINRMIWLRENEPENFAKTAKYADVHCYLSHRLTDRWATSTASADPSGMLDISSRTWSKELLASAGIPLNYMPDLADPGEVMGNITARAAAQTGLLEGTLVVAGGGDGQCAACGAGAVEPSTAYVNLGTAIVAGVYSSIYRYDKAYRTELAISDSGYILETVLKTGTFLIDWFVGEIFGVSDQDKASFLVDIEKEALKSPIGAGGITILPFWLGSMTPHWDAQARGVIVGMSASSKRGDLYRALCEGLALDHAYAFEKAVTSMDVEVSSIVAIGGGTASNLLLQIIADATNTPVGRAKVTEASALGAAMCAAKGAGWYGSLSEASKAMCQKELTIFEPIAENVSRYAQLRAVYDDLWPCLSDWNKRLQAFANSPHPTPGN